MCKSGVFLLNILITLTVVPLRTDCARILCVFQLPAPSHHQTFKSIAKALSLRGHEVISVTPLPINDPTLTNLTEIRINDPSYDGIFGDKFEFNWSKELYLYDRITRILTYTDQVADVILGYEPFRKIYTDKNQKFDLIIVQTYLSPVMFALSKKLNAPIIGVSSMGLWSGSQVAAGNPNPPSIYSEMYAAYNGDLTFCERIKSTLYYLWTRYHIYFVSMPRGDKIAKKHLGTDLPYLADIERNVSAWFMNINSILYTPRPLVPTVVPLSFLHIEPPKTLPEDIKKEVESSKNGFIYFSLGSSVKAVNVPAKITALFIEVMAELPYKVLWKFENERLVQKPKNVVIRPWFPQQDVLAHPKIKLFVTQCGLQSFEEAVDREVPMVCIPFISDQEMNSRELTRLGIIKQIDYLNTTKEELLEAIIDVAENPIYKQRVKELRQLLLDEPMTGIQKAVWWAEYVIRYKGTRHLKSPYAHIEWYKYFLLDVFAVIIGGPLLVLIILLKFIKLFLKPLKKNEKKFKRH